MSRRTRQATKRQVQQRQDWQKLNPHPHDWADQERRLAHMERDMQGFVRRREPFYLCEIGLRDVPATEPAQDHPQTMPEVIRTRRSA
ncbi:hypothetical protein CTI14_02305 [Methylobacterium radiotolerans]|nr:hypothetical protein CTI14_02305 [Methylobacterium radiotolerans]